jgi:hypothetical protein
MAHTRLALRERTLLKPRLNVKDPGGPLGGAWRAADIVHARCTGARRDKHGGGECRHADGGGGGSGSGVYVNW